MRAVRTGRSPWSRATISVRCLGQEMSWGTVWGSPLPHKYKRGRGEAYRNAVIVQDNAVSWGE